MLYPSLFIILPKLELQRIMFRIAYKLCVTRADILTHLMNINKRLSNKLSLFELNLYESYLC